MSKEINFYKMEGAGNDFIVIDNRVYGFPLDEIIEMTPTLCDRKFGIGADGILVLEKAQVPEVDYTMIYRNADGSDAGMCGNGSRCLALFASQNGFDTTQTFNVHDKVYQAEITDDDISVFFPVEVYPSRLVLNGIKFTRADAATEHLVSFVSDADLEDEENLAQQGRLIRTHKEVNPPGCNVNFVHLRDDGHIDLQTYERGVENLTLACGTGALASAIATHEYTESREEHSEYQVHVKGGKLRAAFDYNTTNEKYYNLILRGPANFVFEGIITV